MKEEWEIFSFQLLLSIPSAFKVIKDNCKAGVNGFQWLGAEPSVQHHAGLSRVVSTTGGNVKSLREFKFVPIVLCSLGHYGKFKCGFRHIYLAGLRSAVAGQLIICALSVILTAKGALRRVTRHYLFSERVCNNPSTEMDQSKRCFLSGNSLINFSVVSSPVPLRPTIFSVSNTLGCEKFNCYRNESLI